MAYSNALLHIHIYYKVNMNNKFSKENIFYSFFF